MSGVLADLGLCSPPSTHAPLPIPPCVLGIVRARYARDSYGAAILAATKKSADGLYDTQNDPLGNSTGIRQYYRYGIYSGSALFPTRILDPVHWSSRLELTPSSRGLRVPERRKWDMYRLVLWVPYGTVCRRPCRHA